MFFRLGCLFVLMPLVELALLLQVGRWIGVWPTIWIVAVTGLLGAALAQRQGLRTLERLRSEMARGAIPAGSMADGAAILAGGLLLLTPGILSDLLGFALLFPPTRQGLKAWALRRLVRGVQRGDVQLHFMGGSGFPPGPPPGPTGSPHPDASTEPGDRPPRPGEIFHP